ncbi:hypothetical protein [Phyllobacterium sp. 22552]|uniref:hypothetical protein n=1 Tax=Phyllobacterium sp. 22552 TaxID=3453941 RepID=UPI003F858A07
MNVDDIRNRAQGVKPGAVSPDEVEFARQILRGRHGELGAALYIVGYCGSIADVPLIESYIQGEERNVYGELALKALCRFLNLIDLYRADIRRLVMSDSDIGFRNSRKAAIDLAQDYLGSFKDDEFGCRLVDIYCDLSDANRCSARDALIQILSIRSLLRNPFLLPGEVLDEDAETIVSMAQKMFKCAKSPTSFAYKSN